MVLSTLQLVALRVTIRSAVALDGHLVSKSCLFLFRVLPSDLGLLRLLSAEFLLQTHFVILRFVDNRLLFRFRFCRKQLDFFGLTMRHTVNN